MLKVWSLSGSSVEKKSERAHQSRQVYSEKLEKGLHCLSSKRKPLLQNKWSIVDLAGGEEEERLCRSAAGYTLLLLQDFFLVRLCLKSLGCVAQHHAVFNSSKHLFRRTLCACSENQVFRFKTLE